VQAVLTLDVDLLYNGGIGTYVAGSSETDADVRDAVNDAVRVKASALRAKVVAEGGNLGFTQRARIEYALAGGRINTDAVDNSAGVDMSDHEVNLKICLRAPVQDGRLAAAARDELLAAVTDDVAARVLAHNRAQSRLLSLDQVRSRRRLDEFRGSSRSSSGPPGSTARSRRSPMAMRPARRGTYLGLTRPELAVLMAYAKLRLQHELLASPVPDDPFLAPYLVDYFPAAIVERFPEAVREHPLRREIVATEVANTLVDELGTTFVHRVTRDTGAMLAQVVRAWAIGWVVADGARLVAAIATLAAEVETACRLVLERTIERATKWILANTDPARPAADVAAELGGAIARVRDRLPEWIAGAEAETFSKLRSELEIAGLPGPLARDFATADWLTGALDVVTVAREADVDRGGGGGALLAPTGDRLRVAVGASRRGRGGRPLAGARRRRARRGPLRRAGGSRPALAGASPPARPVKVVQELIRDLRAAPRVELAALEVVVREIRRLAEEV
jgi:glutamate dehydrogenase